MHYSHYFFHLFNCFQLHRSTLGQSILKTTKSGGQGEAGGRSILKQLRIHVGLSSEGNQCGKGGRWGAGTPNKRTSWPTRQPGEEERNRGQEHGRAGCQHGLWDAACRLALSVTGMIITAVSRNTALRGQRECSTVCKGSGVQVTVVLNTAWIGDNHLPAMEIDETKSWPLSPTSDLSVTKGGCDVAALANGKTT